MDNDVNNLLQLWGLSEYIEIFRENAIDLIALSLLEPSDIKNLIGKVGHQVIFRKKLEDWRNVTSTIAADTKSMEKDFGSMYPNHAEGLRNNFPLYKQNFFEIARKRAEKSKDTYLKSLLTLCNESEEISNLISFLLILCLLGISTIHTKNSIKKFWRPSKSEICDGFIKHVPNEAEMRVDIRERHDKFLGLGLTVQQVSFGNGVVFRPIIDEFNFLRKEVIYIESQTFKGTLYFELGLILGDNLGIHSMMGFVESFSGNFCCRVCKVSKEILKQQYMEDKNLIRNTVNYEADLIINNPSLTGIKEKCVFLDIEGFDIFQQMGVDVMHDVLEGVAKYIISFILTNYTQKYKLFSLTILNEKLSSFQYGPDNKNKPCALEKEHLSRGNVRLSAGEMLTFLRYLGLIIGDYVPQDEPIWNMYITLRKILDMLLSVNITPGTENLLQVMVAELNELYSTLTKENLKPKFHNLIHYHTLKKYGPLSSLWSMRFEAKHRHSKMAARATCNRVNVTLTLAMKHQLQLNEIFLKGKLPSILKVGPDRRVLVSDKNRIVTELLIDPDKTLRCVNWATMSTIHYEKGSVLVLSCHDDYNYDFFVVEKLYIYDSKILISIGYMLITLGFSEHYYAYEVKTPSNIQYKAMFFDALLSPIPNSLNMLPNGREFVRSTIQFEFDYF